MDSQILILSHVAVSLAAIVSGLVVVYGLVSNRTMPGLTAFFLVTTVVTNVSGFFFHRDHLLPSHILAAISIALLIPTLYGVYGAHLRGAWRGIYVAGAVACLYVNVFVLIFQSFLKIPTLHALAPTESSEPAFAGAQGAALLLFILAGIVSFRNFRPAG